MKKLITLLALFGASVLAQDPDTRITITTGQNVSIALAPNGTIDGAVQWSLSGSGVVQGDGAGTNVTYVSSEAGVATLTANATAGTNTLAAKIYVTVTAPATLLNPTVKAVAK